jgi:hypothetical protein
VSAHIRQQPQHRLRCPVGRLGQGLGSRRLAEAAAPGPGPVVPWIAHRQLGMRAALPLALADLHQAGLQPNLCRTAVPGEGVGQDRGGIGGPSQRRAGDRQAVALLAHQAIGQRPRLDLAQRVERGIKLALEAALAVPGRHAVPHQQQAADHRAAAAREAS